MKSLVFLNEADLGELGFSMGQRKLLLEWIRGQRANSQASQSQASQNIEDDSHVLAETAKCKHFLSSTKNPSPYSHAQGTYDSFNERRSYIVLNRAILLVISNRAGTN